MSQDANTFVFCLQQEVGSIARDLKVVKHRAFQIWFGRIVLNLSDDEALEATAVEGANDKGIDLFWIDHEDGKVIIVQAKYSEDGRCKPKVRDVSVTAAEKTVLPQGS